MRFERKWKGGDSPGGPLKELRGIVPPVLLHGAVARVEKEKRNMCMHLEHASLVAVGVVL